MNPGRNEQQFIPASTFKILNSLIGLETAVISDKDHIKAQDGTMHRVSSWNHDHTLETAMQNSVIWYYQSSAREVGPAHMEHYISAVNYGNADISGEIDTFWLEGNIRISPEEQIDFLQRLYARVYSFSAANHSNSKSA